MLLDVAAVVLSDLVAIARVVVMVHTPVMVVCILVKQVRIQVNQFLDYTVVR